MTLRGVLVCAALAVGAAGPAGAGDRRVPVYAGASADATEALRLCLATEDPSAADRAGMLNRAAALAESAVAADDADATAHLAVFCAMGKQLGTTCGAFTMLRRLPRLKAEIDRAVELAPDYPGALIAKGAMLLELPKVLGGDRDAAEALLRRALAIDPANVDAQVYLGRALAARGDVGAARQQISRALESAEVAARPQLAAEARTVLAHLDE
jgi:tetratricopeptide (TPR) repeat protein